MAPRSREPEIARGRPLSSFSGGAYLQWKVSAKALTEWQLLEGVYVLKTNLPTRSAPLASRLRQDGSRKMSLAV